MKIDKSGKTPTVTPLRDGTSRAQGSRTADTPSSSGATGSGATPQSVATNVHLGETAGQLMSLQHAASSAPVVDSKKVAEIKQAISEGRFQVNASAVADGLIASVRDLVSARQSG